MATSLDTYMPYDSGPGSNVTEDGWRQFARHFRGDGVIRAIDGEFKIFGDSTGMQVKVPAGECWIRGQWGKTSATKTLPIASAHATLGRYDLVILRNDFVNNRIEMDVITGVAAASPAAPTVTQNTSLWEIQLGTVFVGAAVATITAGNVNAIPRYTDGSCRYGVDTGYQTIVTATDSRVDFDVSMFDSSEVARPSIREFTLLRGGFWMIELNVYWDTNATNARECWIQRQGDGRRVAYSKVQASSSGGTAQNIIGFDRFAANTIIEAYVFQSSGGNRLLLGENDNGTSIAFYWLGP